MVKSLKRFLCVVLVSIISSLNGFMEASAMEKKAFNKLVRDRIPEIISEKGGTPEYKILDNDDYIKMLDDKLLEECNEVLKATNKNDKIEELADLLEVIRAISKSLDTNFETIEEVRLSKKAKRGGFDSKIFLKNATVVNL